MAPSILSLLPLTLLLVGKAQSVLLWKDCEEKELKQGSLECATLGVPLDYTDDGSKEIELKLARVPALIQPSMGSIMVAMTISDSGGRSYLNGWKSYFQAMTGGKYDLVAFDQRGSASTLSAACYDDDEYAQMVTDWWDMLQADVLPGDSAKIWRSADKVMKKCKKQAGENAPFISTAFSARDVMRIVDALGEGDKLRYFGAYSGTVLGSTLAAMFPERIDKMVLDSNSDPEEWHTSQALFSETSEVDAWLDNFITKCWRSRYYDVHVAKELVSMEGSCQLADAAKTEEELRIKIKEGISALRKKTLWVDDGGAIQEGTVALNSKGGKFGFTLTHFQWAMNTAMQVGPEEGTSWHFLSLVMYAMIAESRQRRLHWNLSQLLGAEPNNQGHSLEDQESWFRRLSPMMTTLCNDNRSRSRNRKVLDRIKTQKKAYGQYASEWNSGTPALCHQWEMEPKERYEGSFKADTSSKGVLIVNFSHGGPEPLRNANKIASLIKPSVVNVLEGYGIGVFAYPSICMLRKISGYWLSDTVPKDGSNCALKNEFNFRSEGNSHQWDDIIKKTFGLNSPLASLKF